MSTIIKFVDEENSGVATRAISGMSLFAINGVSVSTEHDPRIVFLRIIARTRPCAGHIGTITLNDICGNYETTGTFMSRRLGATEFIGTQYGVDEGDFYTFGNEDVPGGFVVPSIDDRFWQLGFSDEKGDNMEYVMRRGAAAIYVDPLPQSSLPSLLAPNITTGPASYKIETSIWMDRVLDNFQSAFVVGHDGVTLDAYAKNLDDLAYLEIGMAEAEQSILNNPWFQANKDKLVWDDFDECLKLPKP